MIGEVKFEVSIVIAGWLLPELLCKLPHEAVSVKVQVRRRDMVTDDG